MKFNVLYAIALLLLVATALLVLHFVQLHHNHIKEHHQPGSTEAGSATSALVDGGRGHRLFDKELLGLSRLNGGGILPDNHPVVVQSDHNIEKLLTLIKIQNETIMALENLLQSQTDKSNSNNHQIIQSNLNDCSKTLTTSSRSSCPPCNINSDINSNSNSNSINFNPVSKVQMNNEMNANG